ncbi:unnamed protein product [Amoebophrya sp. A25]|nr:unnamed protein product [Amoebophrya sp. A25]|eukprot:GSA25T00012878001.1
MSTLQLPHFFAVALLMQLVVQGILASSSLSSTLTSAPVRDQQQSSSSSSPLSADEIFEAWKSYRAEQNNECYHLPVAKKIFTLTSEQEDQQADDHLVNADDHCSIAGDGTTSASSTRPWSATNRIDVGVQAGGETTVVSASSGSCTTIATAASTLATEFLQKRSSDDTTRIREVATGGADDAAGRGGVPAASSSTLTDPPSGSSCSGHSTCAAAAARPAASSVHVEDPFSTGTATTRESVTTVTEEDVADPRRVSELSDHVVPATSSRPKKGDKVMKASAKRPAQDSTKKISSTGATASSSSSSSPATSSSTTSSTTPTGSTSSPLLKSSLRTSASSSQLSSKGATATSSSTTQQLLAKRALSLVAELDRKGPALLEDTRSPLLKCGRDIEQENANLAKNIKRAAIQNSLNAILQFVEGCIITLNNGSNGFHKKWAHAQQDGTSKENVAKSAARGQRQLVHEQRGWHTPQQPTPAFSTLEMLRPGSSYFEQYQKSERASGTLRINMFRGDLTAVPPDGILAQRSIHRGFRTDGMSGCDSDFNSDLPKYWNSLNPMWSPTFFHRFTSGVAWDIPEGMEVHPHVASMYMNLASIREQDGSTPNQRGKGSGGSTTTTSTSRGSPSAEQTSISPGDELLKRYLKEVWTPARRVLARNILPEPVVVNEQSNARTGTTTSGASPPTRRMKMDGEVLLGLKKIFEYEKFDFFVSANGARVLSSLSTSSTASTGSSTASTAPAASASSASGSHHGAAGMATPAPSSSSSSSTSATLASPIAEDWVALSPRFTICVPGYCGATGQDEAEGRSQLEGAIARPR